MNRWPCNCVRDVISAAYQPPEGARQVRYTGDRAVTMRGPSGNVYRFDGLLRVRWVDGRDLALFEGRADFEVLEPASEPA